LKIATFYADAELQGKPRANQKGFDWRQAIKHLTASAKRLGIDTVVVTDKHTEIDAWMRVGDAKDQGVMDWLLLAQREVMRATKDGQWLLVSPDTLLHRSPAFMFGPWDLCLLTRPRPKPIVNSVIAYTGGPKPAKLWGDIYDRAQTLPQDSREWGADIDAVVDVLKIKPEESGLRTLGDTRIKFYPMKGVFRSVKHGHTPKLMTEAIWDFKGPRKSIMDGYARLLCR
jgi:hypothetical protein